MSNNINIDIDKKWLCRLNGEIKKPYMIRLFKNLKESKKIIYPDMDDIFNCFKFTKFNDVKVVLLGQDPYCLKGQAHGLSFSIPRGVKLTSSLINIYKELYSDLGIFPRTGNLCNWAEQGVLLLNSILTVEEFKPGSHINLGWEDFTDFVIKTLSDFKRNVIFVLWGKEALKKIKHINEKKHIIIYSSHPSGKSAFVSFFGSRVFSKINMHLKLMGKDLIDWNIY